MIGTRLWTFQGGVHPPEHKALSCHTPIAQAAIPDILILPLLQHIGESTEPVVKIGETVKKGQLIAAHKGSHLGSLVMSAPVHAPSSGTVIAIEPLSVPHPSGLDAPCIVIETDGEDEWIENNPLAIISDYRALLPAQLREHIAQAGVVGLGGAGFPSHLKLHPEGIDTLIINGAECEPYITCDDRLMQEYPHEIVEGAKMLLHILGGAQRCVIAVEDNKPLAYKALQATAHGEVEVMQVPTIYPMGGERQLIQVLTGKEVRKSDLPASIGIVMHNVETTRAIYRAVKQGRPLISRVVTVTGSGVENPQNLETLLGSPMTALIDQCQRKPQIERLVMGGTMMGFALPTDALPVVKTTNCLIVSCPEEVQARPPAMPCIRCGKCAESCPIQLLPQQLYWYAKAKDLKRIKDYHLFDCIDCGCCAYVCPSRIPLVDYFRYAKSEIRANERERKQADIARKRHEFRTFRLEREKSEKAARHKQKTTLPDKATDTTETSKQAEIAAAVQRTQAKKTAQKT